ncbi:HTH domain-containing protein [Pasteurella skyensis]|uniref:HTH domain-containing protein n=1 Tax=Phocoenobacter skyensis TaxID=97481 RepID=UPI0027940A1B|nr:HTH domain-containing protein [Pasteurella skyensis]MDP8170600.1 HTH domain-containing protein [Pasteurella skyensis]
MIKSKHLSAYTPSNMSPETLEFIFVQRHKLLEKSVGWIEESLLTDKKNHLLFVGARGSGKTHLITMIINRLKVSKNLDDLVVIWLGEDDVIMSLTSFALAIINKMASTYPIRFNNKCLEEAKGKNPDEVANIILEDIKKQAGHTTLLIVKENMSDVFYGLKDLGQKRLRAYLQENNHISLLGTSQKLFDGVSSRNSAFWGFFDIHHLNSLSVKEASQLISNIAKLNQDDELVDFLNSSQGNYRIRALHYLAGGNHRLYIELANFLTKASLDNFVDAITQLADHLTPYFQERIRSLSPQQGAIIQKLCELNGAIQVKIIAEALFIDERAVASQLQILKEMGYVIVHKRGRAAYYEIAEPLLRLSLEVKNNHGKPLKIIASLFRAWFSDKELLENRDKGNLLLKEYCQTALEQKEILSYLKKSIYDDLQEEINKENNDQVIKYASELLCLSEIIEIEKELKLDTLYNRSIAYYNQEDTEQELEDLTTLIEMEDSSNERIAKALLRRGEIYLLQGDKELGLTDLTKVIEMENISSYIIVTALFHRCFFNLINKNILLYFSDIDKISQSELASPKIRSLIKLNNVPLYYHLLDIKSAHNSIKRAFVERNKETTNSPFSSENIVNSVIGLGIAYWQKEIEFLLPLYNEYQSLPSLATGLISSIQYFINNETMHSSFRKWAELWREASATYPEMQPAIEALNASVEALAVGNDKPLFVLPKEIRELILPMFGDKLN